jgi:hypothetical protein
MLDLRNLTVVEEKWFQKEAAERLAISDTYLRELDKYFPPRAVNGSGHESQYEWPALMFWFFEYHIAALRMMNGLLNNGWRKLVYELSPMCQAALRVSYLTFGIRCSSVRFVTPHNNSESNSSSGARKSSVWMCW